MIYILIQHGWEKNISVMLMGHVQGIFLGIEKMGRSNGEISISYQPLLLYLFTRYILFNIKQVAVEDVS